eukprot:TRINITY_DN107650_c0_g1_i1.p1 TRINITY_DN107650_c0_g1~~TRINITY_DN107650_c0_g1_i1.p1  ORF type:complete len:593 (-),score=114.67 TRINITY_DN107650_c0_g1_i1:49-1752(-)
MAASGRPASADNEKGTGSPSTSTASGVSGVSAASSSSGSVARASSESKLFFHVRDSAATAVLKSLEASLPDPGMRYKENNQDLMFFAAARKKHHGATVDITRRLLELGCAPNSEDQLQQTPLFFAAREGNEECAMLLIERRCDVNHRDVYGQTAIFYAMRENQLAMVEQLIERGASLNVRDSRGHDPVNYAPVLLKEKVLEKQKWLDSSGHPNPAGRKALVSVPVTRAKSSRGTRMRPSGSPSESEASPPGAARDAQPSGEAPGEPRKRRRITLNHSNGKAESSRKFSGDMLHWVYQDDGSAGEESEVAGYGTSVSSRRSVSTRRGAASVALTAPAAPAEPLVHAGEYFVCVPSVSRVGRLRVLEREFVLDHYEIFSEESWHSQLLPQDWCGIVNVLFEEDTARQAIANIIDGRTPHHQTLECVWKPASGGTDSEFAPSTVGYVHVYCSQGRLDISHLKVCRNHQRKGLGSLLLAGAVKRAAQLGWDAKHLQLVAVSRNLPAISLYRKLGLESIGSPMDKPVRAGVAKVEWQTMGRPLRGEAASAFEQMCVSIAQEAVNRAASSAAT